MGTWGVAAFENDDACDWAYQVAESADVAVVRDALSARDETIGLPSGVIAVAAAEIVASALDAESDKLPDHVAAWVSTHRAEFRTDDADAALAILGRVQAVNSELAEVWTDDEDWAHSVRTLRARLEIART
jgi:hypothetical protein